MAKKKPKVGRPRRHEGMRLSKNRTFRIRDDLDLHLETAARLSGRSVSEEIEYRLDRTFLEGRLTPPRHEDAIRAVRLAMDASSGAIGSYWPGPPFDEEQRARAEEVRTVVNIIIAAVAKLPPEPPPVEKWSTEAGEWARHLLGMIHVEWPQSLASLAKRMEEDREADRKDYEEEMAEQARFLRKTKKTPVDKPK